MKALLLSLLSSLHLLSTAATPAPCQVEIVDDASGWPVPLVELRTTHQLRFVSDNAGRIALDRPELFNVETWFHVQGHGYSVPKDAFDYRGVRLTPKPGLTLKVKVHRDILARRLGRITGGGLFSESQKLGLELDWPESGIVGSDSVQCAIHNGKLFWLWGDTTLPDYPLGIFHSSSATTPTTPLTTLAPPVRLKLNYFRDPKGTVRAVCKMPGKGPTWVTGYTSLPDTNGHHHLVGTYMKINPPLEAYVWGLATWNENSESFESSQILWTKSDSTPKPPPLPEGHPTFWTDPASGKKWVLFGNPFPTLRFPANFESWKNPTTWEVLAPPTLIAASHGSVIKPHSGSIAWNGYRKKWIALFVEKFGKPSPFGEVWITESTSPLGPWSTAIKVLSHDNYTFYNPRLHPEFTPENSPILIFEGTFSKDFADRPQPSPHYDYNQILYRLDLDEPGIAALLDKLP